MLEWKKPLKLSATLHDSWRVSSRRSSRATRRLGCWSMRSIMRGRCPLTLSISMNCTATEGKLSFSWCKKKESLRTSKLAWRRNLTSSIRVRILRRNSSTSLRLPRVRPITWLCKIEHLRPHRVRMMMLRSALLKQKGTVIAFKMSLTLSWDNRSFRSNQTIVVCDSSMNLKPSLRPKRRQSQLQKQPLRRLTRTWRRQPTRCSIRQS